MAYHYDTYREELGKAYPGFGHALWEPDPGEQSPPVGVGDVGFIREGRFHRLFNALLPADDPSHEIFGVPADHEPLRLSMPNHINRGALAPNAFYSHGVTMISGGFGVLAATTMGSAEVSFSCTRKRGAVLSFPVVARREDTVSQDHFRKWIIRYIDSWLAFTRMHGLGIEMEDIILVTGCHHTRSWTNVAFNEVQAGAQLSLKVDVADAVGANVNWGVSNVRIHGTVHNQGPSGENLPENQCIFVRGFRVKRTLKIFPRVKGAAGPTPDPSGSDDEPETEVVSIPSFTKQAPHCDLVLVHDDDLERILGAGDGTIPSNP
ncbi:hypothetical protein EDB85DRAFT_1890861 [Lactarius pseudohatsudake]|nr:hypothetical protein EDB85DRAFT_1890861 [Lactarius pseudohatsudake]